MFVYNVPFRKCHTHIGKFNYKTTDWSTKYNDNSYPYWWHWLPSEWVIGWVLLNANSAICQLYHDGNLMFNDMMVRFVLEQHAELVHFFYNHFYSASSLKQQTAGGHVAPFWHIILIPSRSVFALSPYSFGVTQLVLECMTYQTRGEHANHYTIDGVMRRQCLSFRSWFFLQLW